MLPERIDREVSQYLDDISSNPRRAPAMSGMIAANEKPGCSCADAAIWRVLSDGQFLMSARHGLFWKNLAYKALDKFHEDVEAKEAMAVAMEGTLTDKDREKLINDSVKEFLMEWIITVLMPFRMVGKGAGGNEMSIPAGSDANGNEGEDMFASLLHKDQERYGIPSMEGAGGMGIGTGSSTFDKKQQSIFMKRIPRSLYDLARLIGRAGDNPERSSSGRFQTASKSDINGITTGDNLTAMLPSEVALLSDRSTEIIFYSRYAGKKLQLFSSASSGATVQSSRHENGPIIICVDMSGSMKGEPLTVARTMATALCIIARRERRDVLVIKYSDDWSVMLVKGIASQLQQLESFLSVASLGGNNENGMFEWLFDVVLPSMKEFSTADTLCISDFGWMPIEKSIQNKIEREKQKGMKFYGLNIGSSFGLEMMESYPMNELGADPMSVLDSVWVYDKGECREVSNSRR